MLKHAWVTSIQARPTRAVRPCQLYSCGVEAWDRFCSGTDGYEPKAHQKIKAGTPGGRGPTRPRALAHINDQPVTVATNAQQRTCRNPRERATRLSDWAICVVGLALCLDISTQRIEIGDDVAGLFVVNAHCLHGVAWDDRLRVFNPRREIVGGVAQKTCDVDTSCHFVQRRADQSVRPAYAGDESSAATILSDAALSATRVAPTWNLHAGGFRHLVIAAGE